MAQTSLVPCGLTDPVTGKLTSQCQFCHLIELIQRVINFIVVQLAAPVATLLFAWAGIRLVTQAGNEEARKQAKQLLKDVLIGFLWVLLAWSAVIAVLNILVKTSDMPTGAENRWFKIQCFDYPVPNMDFTTFQGGGLSNIPVTSQDCPGCVVLSSNVPTNGNACKGESSGGKCQVNPAIASNVELMFSNAKTAGLDIKASELWPPVADHSDPCHRYGTCLDVSLPDKSATNIKSAQKVANDSSMRMQWEIPKSATSDTRLAELKSQGVTDVIVVAGIKTEHGSVYVKGYKN